MTLKSTKGGSVANDLFRAATEMAEERAAILEFDGLMTREEAERLGKLEAECWRMACEVRWICDMPDRKKRADYLAMVEKQRGMVAANELKRMVFEEWDRRKKVGK